MSSRPVIIVTGASRGIGASTARMAGRLGAALVLAGRSTGALQQASGRVLEEGGQALVAPADVSHEAGCQAIVDQALGRFGRIDALINNAGVSEPIGPMSEADPQAWAWNWSVNVMGPVLLVKLALPHLRASGGRVIFISSGAAENPIAGWGAYSASKAAGNQITRVLAAEEPSITAIAVRPGIVDTDMQAAIREQGRGQMDPRNYNYLVGLHEQGRLLPPDAPGKAIACLAVAAPKEWSGRVLQWDDAPVQELVRSVWKEG